MRVRQRLMLSLTTLVGCTAVLGGAALVGMASLRHSYDAAEEQYQELRSLYEIGFRASSIRLLLNGSASDGAAIERHLFAASQEADRLRDRQAGSGGFGGDEIESVRASIQGRLRDVAGHVESGIDSEGLRADVNRWLGQVSTLATATQNGIVENRTQAKDRFRVAMEVMAGTFAATVLVAALVGTSQYRSVMVPLRALDAAVAEVAGIRFGRRLRERGDREFRRVTRHFNRMSRTIEEMHSSMRQQVEVKTRQLLRSEQLAGVGSLAAGLAHEINNPLAIIAGYAQTALAEA